MAASCCSANRSKETQVNKVFEKQGWHVFLLALLLAGVITLSHTEGTLSGSLWGIATSTWFWLSVLIPIIHQVFVGLGWRAQLHSQWMTRVFGEKAFLVFSIVFMLLFLARPVSMILLALSNAGSISLNAPFRDIASVVLFIPLPYLMHSIVKYFGVERALGIDHFDPTARNLPLVKQGIFKYVNNAMYSVGFLALWIPGILWASKGALLSAAFSHLYIWVHYFTVEKPDMQVIYGGGS
jgi:membrane glycosyltransferase